MAIGPTLHLSGECGVGPRPAIAARKRWRRCSTYARPVSGAVVCHKSNEEDFPPIVTMVTPLFILRCVFFSPSPRQAFAPAANACGERLLNAIPPRRGKYCNYLRLVHQQMTNTHLSASSKERRDNAAEFQLDFFSPVNMSVKV